MSIIHKYNMRTLLNYVRNYYDLNPIQITETSNGLDNSVYTFVDPEKGKFVLKIIETKLSDQIEQAIRISKNICDEFTLIKYKQAKSGDFLHYCQELSKYLFIYHYVEGVHPELSTKDEAIKCANLIASFHALTPLTSTDTLAYVTEEFKLIEKYWSESVKKGLSQHFVGRLKFYTSLLSLIEINKGSLIDNCCKLPGIVGLTHTDLSPENILVTPSGEFTLIDFDGVCQEGFTSIDLLQCIAKSPIIQSRELLGKFIDEYYLSLGLLINRDNVIQSIYAWVILFSCRAMLSTEYYTFDIPKLSPSWNKQNAGPMLKRLRDAAVISLRELSLGNRYFEFWHPPSEFSAFVVSSNNEHPTMLKAKL